MKTARGFAAAAALLLLCGCAQAGDILGGVLGGGQPVGGVNGGTVVAEVRSVDARNGVLAVRTEEGQNVDIRFDQNVRVVYRQQEYPVTALESGDVVQMSVSRSGNEYYTQQIDVQQSVQDRGGMTGGVDSERLYQISGTVDQIDQTRGLFTVRTSSNQVVTVTMPYNASSTSRDRFARLRRGNGVSVEGWFVTQDRLELSRFL